MRWGRRPPHPRPADGVVCRSGVAHGQCRRTNLPGRQHGQHSCDHPRVAGAGLDSRTWYSRATGGQRPERPHHLRVACRRHRSAAVIDQALWALGRGTGITALAFMTVALFLGIATRSGRPLLMLPRFAVAGVHRFASLPGTVLVVLHIALLFFDPYAHLRPVDFIQPFLGAYRPVWLGLGTLVFDLLAVVMVTSLLLHRLCPRALRAVNWATHALWPAHMPHPLGNGTDAGHAWF